MKKKYDELIAYLEGFIPEKTSLKFSGIKGIYRTKHLLRLLGDPQEKLRVVHIAGTSGKGSTSYLISLLLKVHGFKVGFQISPHLVDLGERFQINSQNIPHRKFLDTFNEILPLVEKAKQTEWGKLTYFEVLVAFAFYYFYKEKVDYCVMETGLGGLYDGTNVVNNPDKLAVITKIGLDHQWVLGNTLSEIAFQKAGIIQKGNNLVTLRQPKAVMQVFEQTVKKQKAKMHMAGHVNNVGVSREGTSFNGYHVNLIGRFQGENASLALKAVEILSRQYKFTINDKLVRQAFDQAIFPGRFELHRTKYRDIVIDGAHNPQKMKAFITSLKELYPDQKFTFLISFSRSKDQIPTMRGMLKYLIPLARKIYISEFSIFGQDLFHKSVVAMRIALIIERLGFFNYKTVEVERCFLKKVLMESREPLVITGSLYFIGSIYRKLKNAIMEK